MSYAASHAIHFVILFIQQNQVRENIDFAAMTGRKADARALADIKSHTRLTSNSKTSSGPSGSIKDARPKKHQIVIGDPGDNNDSGWNIFDHAETETVIPPNPLRTKWMEESLNRSKAPDDDVQAAKRAGRPKKEVQKSRSNINHNTL